MARFLDNASDINKSVQKKKKKKEETVKKVQSPSVSQNSQRTQQAQNQKTYGGMRQQSTVKRANTSSQKTSTQQKQQTTSQQTQRTIDRLQQKYGVGSSYNRQATRRTQPKNSTISREGQHTVDRLTLKYGQNRVQRNQQEIEERRQASNQRRLEAQRQKSGFNSMATPEQSRAVNRAIKNTPGLVKKALKDTVSGHAQTIADLTEMSASNENGVKAKAMKMGIDPEKDKKQMAEVERERQRTAEEAKLTREKLASEQDQRQQEWEKKINGAGGLEKAYYGAVESGTGMLTDLVIGLGTQGGALAAMGSRTYGTTRGQAEKEGATENEDRLYSFLQAAKEVGTELMFPGAGLAKGYASKKVGLPLAERAANYLTKNMASRTAADLTGAGVRLLGGTVEENLEEVAGWGLDPIIKEFSYGRNTRMRQAQDVLKQESDALRGNIQNEDDARRAAAYLSSADFIEQNKQQYLEAGLNEKQSQQVAELMRDYLTASLTGDTDTMDDLEQKIAQTVSGKGFSAKDWDLGELKDTIASTSLLTLTTGLPGTATTAMRGSVIRDNLGTDGIRALAETAMNYEDKEASIRGQAARDRIDSGKELTSTQVFELAQSQAQQIARDTQRVEAKNNVVAESIERDNLVAPMIMRDEKGNIHGDAVITSRYNESAKKAESALNDIISQDKKLSLSSSDVAVGSRAIAGFETGAFTINDANALNFTNTAVRDAFEKVTGIDLGKYVVRDSKGEVDISETNAKTKDALFAMAADNYVETARAETENFNDIVKGQTAQQVSARIGSNGDAAIVSALGTVDPADESNYDLMASAAQNVYESARYTNESWETARARLGEMYPSLSQEALQEVYEAAKQDKTIAETPYYNAIVKAGESLKNRDMSEAEQSEYGKFTNDTGKEIGMKERAVLESIARQFNINIRLMPSESFKYKYVDRNGKEKTGYSNGTYDPKTGNMLLNGGNDMDRNIIAVALHEITHHIATYAPEEYLALSNRVMEAWFKNDPEAFKAAIQRKQDNYKAQVGQTLSEEQALEEVIADAIGEMNADPDFIDQICQDEPNLARQIINAIKSVLRKLRAILASGDVAEEYEDAFFNQLDIWADAERLWMQAAKVAQQNRGDMLIDEWNENTRQRTVEEPETRHSINDADIMPEEEAQNRLEENFDDYKEDKDSLRLATEAITDLQNVRYSVAENTSDISGRWSRGEQVRTIGKGITADLVNEGYVEFRGRKVKGPEDLAKLCQVLRDPRFETFRVVLTKGDKIVSLRSISSRLPGLAQAFESENISDGVDIVRDRMKRTGADGYYLIHNHPSGNVTASFADLSVTRAYLALLGQDTYKGHIILDHDKYGFIDADVPQVIRGENFPTAREESITGQQTFDLIHEPEIDHPLLGEEIHGHADIAKCGQFVNASDDVSVLLYTNSPGEVTGIQEISNKTLKNNKEITGFIRNQGVEFGAASAFLYTTDIETYQASKDLVKSGHLVDSVVAYGNNRQWSESAREVVSPRADVEVLGQVHDDVIRRTHVFESATGVTEYRYSLPETDNEGKALTQDQREFFRDVAPELLDDNGNIKRYFHGTARADRVGYYFNPERATSGPMAYFTDNRDIAANYSRDKADTSLAYEGEDVNDYHNQFVVDVDGEEVRLEDYWYQLPANKRIEYRERAGHITYDYDGEDDTALIINENVSNGNGGYGADPYLVRQSRGNVFRMLIDAWLDSGDFFNEEERFLEVMDLLGVEGVRYKDPNYREEKVYEVYLNVTNPLVTTELDEEFAADVEDWLDNTDLDYYARESASADMWDKNDRDPYDWLEALRDDIENGTTHVWTSIPDVITDFLREQGYDGIVDQGGKYHEAGHQVVIPFEPNQIKLTTNEHPTEDVDIRYSIAETDSEGNFLSDGQRRYFNNSLAVDEQGRLVPVYHTTNKGGFTIFDPSYSDDKRSLFFASNFDVSQTYGRNASSKVILNPEQGTNEQAGYYEVYLNLQNPLIVDNGHTDNWSSIQIPKSLQQDMWDYFGYMFSATNTRRYVEFAAENGYDGVIFRNIRDIGGQSPLDSSDVYSDVYVAFKPEQIKDIRNLDPTNNPDIRYSIVDEDEAMSHMAHEDSFDDSVETMEYYESIIADMDEKDLDDGFINHPMQVFLEKLQKYGESDAKARGSKNKYKYRPTFKVNNEEELMNEFYAGLNSYTDHLVFADPVVEEGRKRMARSRSDYMDRLNAEWNENWLTNGEVLDLSSVRKEVRQLVMGVMRNSDTDRQYKSDIVNKTLIDIRLAYEIAKKGRIEIADALLWHSAQRMIENVEFVNDDMFQQYKDLRDYLRTTRIQLGEEYWADVDYQAFRKNNFGRMKLVKGETNVDEIYQEMHERWPEWFDEEEDMTPPDQLLQIEHVLDVIQPYKEAYSSEEAASIITDIAYDLSDIVYGKGKPYESIADKYKNRYDKQTQAMRQRHEEALRKAREQRDEGIKAERAKWKAREQERRERAEHKKAFEKIKKNYDWFTTRLLNPTKDKNIPVELQQPLAELLIQFDFQTERSKALEEVYGPAKKTLRMRELKDRIAEVAKEDGTGDLPYNSWLNAEMEALTKTLDGTPVDMLSAGDMALINEVLKTIRHGILTHKQVKVEGKAMEAQAVRDEIGKGARAYRAKYGDAKKYGGLRDVLDKIVNMSELTPIYFFERITGMNTMYRELRKGFDKYVTNEAEIIDKITEILKPFYYRKKYSSGSEIEKWRGTEEAQTFDFEGGQITLSIAQMMSVYCHSKRAQSVGHMLGDGIIAAPITPNGKIAQAKEGFKGKKDNSNAVLLTEADIQEIISRLTPEQIDVADKFQKLMSEDMAALGNEASRELYDIDMFKDPNYFPLRVSGDVLSTDPNNIDIREKIKNPSFSKPLTPNARNTIVIEDIFSVVASHCNDMNLYNAYAVPISDFMKVYNGKVQYEDGTAETVKTALRGAYSEKSLKYIEHFIDDINGNSMRRNGGLEDALNAALGRAKTAAVFANIRVALQQPTAIVRAAAVMKSKYFVGVRPSKKATNEMIEHCPIARWKNWGYYDTHFGRDIEDVMLNKHNLREELMSAVYGKLDDMTWGMIWQAVKKEVRANNPNVKEGTQEFWDLCNERASEVFDKTQVVDSPMHRSDAMRSKDTLIKQMTSFQAEPTLSFNVLRAGIVNAYDALKDGDKSKATKILTRVVSVWVGQAAVVGAAAAIADAIRGKDADSFFEDLLNQLRGEDGDDDDEEKTFFERWLENTLANFADGLNPINNVYLLKDIVPPIVNALKGDYVYGTQNLMFQWVDTLTTGITQFKKKLEKGDEYDKSWWDVMSNVLGGVGYLTGIPFKTMMKDIKGVAGIVNKLFGIQLDTFADDGSEPVKRKSLQIAGVQDGSSVDNLLNHFGLNLSAREEKERDEARADKARTEEAEKIKNKTAGLSGIDKDKKVWSAVSTYAKKENGDKSYTDIIESGNYDEIYKLRKMYVSAGGNEDYFNERILDASKKALKKSIIYNPTEEQMQAQDNIRNYLLDHGISEASISEIAYKSQTAKELKIAFRLNDKDAMMEELKPLAYAGLTYEDLQRLWDNRNRIDLRKYKESGGKYADRLKSTGVYNWPINGQITSNFGHRSSPGGIGSTNHQGLDIAGSMGDPVGASDGGTVVYAGWYGGAGKTVMIEHDDGTVTQYSHLSWWDVKEGDVVAQGQYIGKVGSTGNSTGPHLHFGVKVNGSYQDPLKYLNRF